MNAALLRQGRDFVRRIDDDELAGLHHHTLAGIRALSLCLALMAPCGVLFVLAEDVHPTRALIALPLHLAFYAALARCAKSDFGFRHTSLLLALLAAGMATNMTIGAEWLHRTPESASLLFATLVPLVIGAFVPWRPMLTVALALPVIGAIFAAHWILGVALPLSATTIVNSAFSIALASAVAIQGQRRLWWRLERARVQLASAEREAKARSMEASQRAADVRRILDNVDQGFVRLNPLGEMAKERSAVLKEWFGTIGDDDSFVALLRNADPVAAQSFRLNWDQLADGFLPLDLLLEQMPARIRARERTLALRYRPVLDDGVLIEVIVVIADITAQVVREQTEAELHNLLSALKHVLADRRGFGQFVREATSLVVEVTGGELPARECVRRLHTLKGNSALFELNAFSQLCHELEARLLDGEEQLPAVECERLFDAWKSIGALAGLDAGEGDEPGSLEISEEEQAALVSGILNGLPRAEIALRVQSWKLEPVRRRLLRLGEKARATAIRLEKGAIDVVIDDGGVRLPSAEWASFWGALVHLVRNALDHGIESAEERRRAGKPVRGQLRLSASVEGERLSIEVADDGRGIDWQAIRDKAVERGLAAETQDDLIEALFADGLSSRSYVTQYSGRGVGMCAVREACVELGGKLDVRSVPGAGTRFTMSFSRPAVVDTAAA